MSKLAMENILNKIKAYDRIILFRHVRPDGDCVGATKGFQRILQLSFPEKHIVLTHEDHSAYLEFLGPEDPAIPDELYDSALGIVLDTANTDRISNKKFKRCKELCKIDHHIDINPYGDVSWVEEESSSCCEMIVKFYDTFKDQLKIDKEAATYLYTGMVTDSGRFRYSSTSGDTMRCAGILLDQGIDTERLFARLYLEAFEYLKFKAHLYSIMKVTENGVAYLYIDQETQRAFGLTSESASATVGTLDSIRGCICWMVFIENDDAEQSIRVRLRSRFVHINQLAERYRGGGHACASGATVYGKEEVEKLLQEADALVKEYKETHEDWL